MKIINMHVIKAAAFIMLLAITGMINAFAQDNNGANNLNNRFVYTGEFKLKGFGFNGTESINNEACYYEYFKAPDDTRIFDGLFVFASRNILKWSAFEHISTAEDITNEDITNIYDEFSGQEMYFALGRFCQDIQVGKWIWINKAFPRIYVCVINFNDNGVPEGDFEIYDLYESYENDIRQYNAPKHYKLSYLSGTIENGVIVTIDYKEGYNIHIRNGVTNYISKVSGHYNKEGYPIGKWSFSGTDYTDFGKDFVVEFDDKGNCIKNYRIDQTTGDHVGLSYNMVRLPIKTAWHALSCISNRRFRSTPHVKWRQNNICKYGCND